MWGKGKIPNKFHVPRVWEALCHLGTLEEEFWEQCKYPELPSSSKFLYFNQFKSFLGYCLCSLQMFLQNIRSHLLIFAGCFSKEVLLHLAPSLSVLNGFKAYPYFRKLTLAGKIWYFNSSQTPIMLYLSCYSKWQIFIFKIRENTAFYESNPISLLAVYEKSRKKHFRDHWFVFSYQCGSFWGVFKNTDVRVKQLKSWKHKLG